MATLGRNSKKNGNSGLRELNKDKSSQSFVNLKLNLILLQSEIALMIKNHYCPRNGFKI
jgi:hypothetical protein